MTCYLLIRGVDREASGGFRRRNQGHATWYGVWCAAAEGLERWLHRRGRIQTTIPATTLIQKAVMVSFMVIFGLGVMERFWSQSTCRHLLSRSTKWTAAARDPERQDLWEVKPFCGCPSELSRLAARVVSGHVHLWVTCRITNLSNLCFFSL